VKKVAAVGARRRRRRRFARHDTEATPPGSAGAADRVLQPRRRRSERDYGSISVAAERATKVARRRAPARSSFRPIGWRSARSVSRGPGHAGASPHLNEVPR